MRKVVALAALVALVSGCSIKHEVVKDYPQYLVNNQGESKLPTTKAASEYSIAPSTQSHHYEFRSVTTGYANLWMVDFGKLLDTTLQSEDVQKAFGRLSKSSDGQAEDGLLLFELQSFTFAEQGAHVSLKVTYRRGTEEVFSKVYAADGEAQGGKMFWGGAFAMKNAIQQSTKLAVDEILRELIADLNKTQRPA